MNLSLYLNRDDAHLQVICISFMHPYILYCVVKSKGKGESVPVSYIFAAVVSALLNFSALHVSGRDKMAEAESHQPLMDL